MLGDCGLEVMQRPQELPSGARILIYRPGALMGVGRAQGPVRIVDSPRPAQPGQHDGEDATDPL